MTLTIGPPQAKAIDDISAEAFAQWKHHPVTRAFLQFLGDQADNWREAALLMWEEGRMDPMHQHPDVNSNVMRGRVLALRELTEISHSDIEDFYKSAIPDSQDQ